MATKYTRKKKVDNIDLDVNHDLVLDSTRGVFDWIQDHIPLVLAGFVAAGLVWGGIAAFAKQRASKQIKSTKALSESLATLYDDTTGAPKIVGLSEAELKTSESALSKLIDSGVSGGMTTLATGVRGAVKFARGDYAGSSTDYTKALSSSGGSLALKNVLSDGAFFAALKQKKWDEAKKLIPVMTRVLFPAASTTSTDAKNGNAAIYASIKEALILRHRGDLNGARAMLDKIVNPSDDADKSGGNVDPLLEMDAKRALMVVNTALTYRSSTEAEKAPPTE